eukprot:1758818-Pleurochrysis_carterae.AAC.1
MSWKDMWALLHSRAQRDTEDNSTIQTDAAPATAASLATSGSALRGNALREHLSQSTRASELNVVLHPGYTATEARRARLEDAAPTYIADNLE